MSDDKQKIITDIKTYISRGGDGYKVWYLGICKDARDRLFKKHKVNKKGDWWIYRNASSSQVAREIEDYFLSILGTDGNPGENDDDSNMIYAFKKASHTIP